MNADLFDRRTKNSIHIKSLSRQRKMYETQKKNFKRSLDKSSLPVNSKKDRELRASLDEEIQLCKEEEMLKPQYPWNQPVKRRASSIISWKKVYSLKPEEILFDNSEKKFLWNCTPGVEEFLTQEQIAQLNHALNLIKYNVRDEQEFKYLQVNLFTDLLDKLIEEAKSLPKDIPSFKRVAALRVFKKNFYD